MAFEESSEFCKYCNRQVLAHRKGTNHILHLLLTVFTGGLWLIMWWICSKEKDNWRCTVCGQEMEPTIEALTKSFYLDLVTSIVLLILIIVFIWQAVKLL